MNYDDHLERYEARLKDLEEQEKAREQRKLIALQEAVGEADQIIRDTIRPELEVLRAALARHSFQSRITTKRDVSELSPDTSFDIEIELREDIPQSNPRRGITFTAIPADKHFTVRMVTTLDSRDRGQSSELKFSDVTDDAVKSLCGRFVQLAFPV